ncbi:hypothetical protein E2C01_074131 [Portunus trituberculatus]|uniref:Uncharacterized protein n=1 Tax=Portunus trituberculatus TaxID=210409 RepID=A0A5B7ICG3_PORTR|nr:hypothetical protein [Portunus trituberculatus]
MFDKRSYYRNKVKLPVNGRATHLSGFSSIKGFMLCRRHLSVTSVSLSWPSLIMAITEAQADHKSPVHTERYNPAWSRKNKRASTRANEATANVSQTVSMSYRSSFEFDFEGEGCRIAANIFF